MAMTYAYAYAVIDSATNQCLAVYDDDMYYTDEQLAAANWIRLEVADPEYVFKYYINGNWYEDAAGTIPWTSSLL